MLLGIRAYSGLTYDDKYKFFLKLGVKLNLLILTNLGISAPRRPPLLQRRVAFVTTRGRGKRTIFFSWKS